MTQEEKLQGKVFVRFTRMDHQGLQNTLKQMNELIEKGYRFTLSDLRMDAPMLRNSQPQFTMSLPDFEQPMELPSFNPESVPSWHRNMEELEAVLAKLEELTKKDQLVAFQEEIKLFAPEDKKQPAAIKVWLAEQIKSYRR